MPSCALPALELIVVTFPRSVRTSDLKAALAVCTALFMAACGPAPADNESYWTPVPSSSPDAATTQVANPVLTPSPATPSPGTPGPARTPNPNAAASPGVPPVVTTVTPSSVQTGGVTLSLALEPARRMIPDAQSQPADPPSDHPQGANDPQPAALTALTLDGLLKVTNNLDPSQPVPPDDPQSVVRHLNLAIRANDGGYPVPYLGVSIDILLDGRPETTGVSVVPMTDPDSATPQLLYYGNNIKLTHRGTYQFFVRMQPSSVLGKDPPPTAEFNVVMR
jgi:Fe2+ transport protein